MFRESIETYSSNRFMLTFVTIIWGTRFFGYAPLAALFPSGQTYIWPIFLFCLYLGYTSNEKSEYTKTLWLFLGCMALNCISAYIFRDLSFYYSFGGNSFLCYIFFFFIIARIKPTPEEIEKVIKCSGIIVLGLYFLQYILLPKPIVESLSTGWRAAEGVKDYDIKRFSVTGESIAFLYGLMCFNKLLLNFSIKKTIMLLLILSMTFLHGYRGYIFAFVLSLFFLYMRSVDRKLDGRMVKMIFFALFFVWMLSNISIFSDMFIFLSEKNQHMSESNVTELDRIMEIDYFFNDYLVSPLEWIGGSGFIRKEQYTEASSLLSFINWVDLGFLGMTFMGGICLVTCWIYLLCLNLRKVPIQYRYINAFTLFLVVGSFVMSVAFSNQAVVIEALTFYLCYRVRLESQLEL